MAHGPINRWTVVLLTLFTASVVVGQSDGPTEPIDETERQVKETQPSDEDENDPAPQNERPSEELAAVDAAAETREDGLSPRFELFIPSAATLVAAVRDSKSGVFLAVAARALHAMAEADPDQADVSAIQGLVEHIAGWPDSSLELFLFAPDVEQRARWLLRVNWAVADFHARIQPLLVQDAAEGLLSGVALRKAEDTSHQIVLHDQVLGLILACGDSCTLMASHPDLPVPPRARTGGEADDQASWLISARMNLKETEQDSGATILSKISFINSVTYRSRIDALGAWVEEVNVAWPPISGLVAKGLVFQRVDQTFFVPAAAIGAVAVSTPSAPSTLDGLAGFGPQFVMSPDGEMTMIGEQGVGPMAAFTDPDICISLLPGTGFLPVPDVVIQVRVRKPNKFIERLEQAADKSNEEFRDRDEREPWQKTTVRDRVVVWNDGMQSPGMFSGWVFRPVLFVTRESDLKDRERNYLVMALTTTAPEDMVRRWLDFSRSTGRQIPDQKKSNGQLWVNWKVAYQQFSPYLDSLFGAVVGQSLLPEPRRAAEALSDASITMKTRYSGLELSHTGPLPLGTVILPALGTWATQPDDSGGSDLARERLACQRLRVFYHHAKLFKKDVGRWPAELAELDGYVDFSGHPGLLQLELSSRKWWSDWWDDFFTSDDDDDSDSVDVQDVAEDAMIDIDDDLFFIEWGRQRWRLGLAPGTLDHLEKLYIDQDGVIHRVEMSKSKESKEVSWNGDGRDDQGHAMAVASRAVFADRCDLARSAQPLDDKE